MSPAAIWRNFLFSGSGRRGLQALLILVFTSACASLETTPRPPQAGIELPASWQQARTSDADPLADPVVDAHADSLDTRRWWQHFGSPGLDALLAEALEANPDLRIGAERLRQAALQYALVETSRAPGLELGAGSSLAWADSGAREVRRSANLGLSTRYEIDLWGRFAAETQSAAAGLDASEFDFAAARLSLSASLATLWFELLASEESLQRAQHNLQIGERILRIVDARHRHGAASALDLARQQSTLLGLRSSLLAQQTQLGQVQRALAVLLGRIPQDAPSSGEETLAALFAPTPGAGVPTEWLLRRPDLAAAEARLAAADADIVAARAALLPSLVLSGSGAFSSASLLVLNSPSAAAQLGASLAHSLFDHGRQRTRVAIAESRRVEWIETYRKAVLVALREVEDALASLQRSEQQLELQVAIHERAGTALKLAEHRYRLGAEDLLHLLDAQRTWFAAEEQLSQSRLARLLAAVEVFKAAGGGWTR